MIRIKRFPIICFILSITGCVTNTTEINTMFRGNPNKPGVFTAGNDMPSGKVKWTFKPGGEIYASPVVNQNIGYIGSLDGQMYAIDIKKGKVKWTFKSEGEIRSTAAISGDLLFFTDVAGNLFALDKNTGKVQWKLASKVEEPNLDQWDYYRSSPIIVGEVLYYGNNNGILSAINIHNGKVLWQYSKFITPIHNTPAVSKGIVYAGYWREGVLVAVDASTGIEKWSTEIGGRLQSSPTIADGIVYVGSRDTFRVHALDETTGKELWNFTTPDGSWITSSPAVDNGVLYIGSSDSQVVHAINAQNGKEKWSFRTVSNIFSSPAVSGKTVYVASGTAYDNELDEALYAIDINSGKASWSVKINSSHSSPYLYKGVVYIADVQGFLYAIE